MKVYIVQNIFQYLDNYCEDIVKVFLNKQYAEEYAEKSNNVLSRFKKHCNEYKDEEHSVNKLLARGLLLDYNEELDLLFDSENYKILKQRSIVHTKFSDFKETVIIEKEITL